MNLFQTNLRHHAFRALLACVLCAGNASARQPASSVQVPVRPCPSPDKANPTCIAEDPHQRALIGTSCERHPRTRLRRDVVEIRYGFGAACPGYYDFTYPNARLCIPGGCVSGIPFAEVAYCSECRAAYRWSQLLSLRHLRRR